MLIQRGFTLMALAALVLMVASLSSVQARNSDKKVKATATSSTAGGKQVVSIALEIDPKYHFLLAAPAKDPDGRPAVIRYSRKTKEQYVQSEVDGKPTGWRAFFDGGKWKVEDKR